MRQGVRDSRASFMFPRYLQYLLTDFRQTFVTGASWDTDDLITFLGRKVKGQGHTIAAEAHSTRRYRRVQLFLVSSKITFAAGVFPMGVFLARVASQRSSAVISLLQAVMSFFAVK